MTIESTLQNIESQMSKLKLQRENVLLLGEKLKDFPHQVSLSVFGEYIDFDNLTRAEVVALITHLKVGKWDKAISSAGETKIDYINTGFLKDAKLRIWGAEPPASCKLVEEEVIIPAQPERVEKRMKLICKEHELAAV